MFAFTTRSGEGVQSASLISASASARGGIELSVLSLQPRFVVFGIFDSDRRLRDLERTEAVHHYGQLVRVFGTDARLRASRMRTVRDPVRVVRDAAEFDSLAAHEFTRRIIEHFVGIHVAVIVRSRHGFRMEVVWTRTERADDESVSLKSLMYRRRLMNAADDRLKIVDVERPRIEVSIPADDIERMMIEHDLVDAVVLLHQNRKISHLVHGLDKRRTPDVALGVRSAFDELPELVPIAFRPAHVSSALECHELGLLGVEVETIPVKNAAMDDEIVALTEGQRAISAFQHARAFAHVNQLVGLRVTVKVRIVLVGLAVEHRDVLIEQKRHPIERRATTFLRARGEEVTVVQRLIGVGLVFRLAHSPHRLYSRWRMNVIEKRRSPGETFVSDQLFGVDPAAW